MAQSLANFAGGGGVQQDYQWDPELSEDILQYFKEESDFRKFLKVLTVDSYVVNLPRKWSTGIAVEVVEGSEIPKQRDVFDVLSVNLRQNGTGIKMTDEEQDMMKFDKNYFQTEAKRAVERLLRKENQDCSLIFKAGAGHTIASANQTVKYDDVVRAKTYMRELPYGTDPDTIIMSPRSYSDLLLDPDFKNYSNSGITQVVTKGDVGQYIAGMRIVIIPEVGSDLFLFDSGIEFGYLVQKGQVHTESYRLNATREDVLDLTFYEKPCVLRPDALLKLEIKRADGDVAKDFGGIGDDIGWDPLDAIDPEKT